MVSKRPSLILIDGFSNIFRAFYAIRNLSSPDGVPTNAVYGFLQMLRKLLRDEQPDLIGVAFDVSDATVRTEKYEEYKANRAPMPEDLVPQIPWIRKVLEAYRVPIVELDRYEADDVLGTLAKQGAAAGYDVVLVSSDKDLMQLVEPHVRLFHTGRSKLYDAKGIEEDFGVPPHQVVEVLALKGDAVDNVPGVPGIGEKGALQLIREYGTVEALLEHAGEIKRKSYREGLQEHRDQALLSKELVTIHTDLPLVLDPKSLRREVEDTEALREICRTLGFRTLLAELEVGGSRVAAIEAAREVESAAAWSEATAELQGTIALGLVGEVPVIGLAVSGGKQGEIVFADFRREEVREAALTSLAGWVGESDRELVGHDLKEILRLVPEAPLAASLFDTMLVSYVLRPSLRGHTLETAALERLQIQAITTKDAGWIRNQEPGVGSTPLLAYAGERVELARRLAERMRPELEEGTLLSVYRDLEEPLVPVLLAMEECGVLLDVEYLAAMSAELGQEIVGLEKTLYEIAGDTFNLNSPQQVGEVMFERLGYPVLKKTRKTKNYSTDADTLQELATRGFPLAEHLLRYRELTKLKSTYVDALPALVAEDGRLHTRFNQAVASTGRLSSANPNLQNIPVRTDLGQRIRKAFRAPAGKTLLVADYSQIELRILAHIAEEPAMLAAFHAGEDIHRATAASVFDVAPVLVSAEQRRAAKVINFGILYGMSAFGLSQNLGISPKEADKFIETYLDRYLGVRRYMDATLESAKAERKVETLYGRVRWLPDIESRNYNLRENARRMAINARIQGTAADLLKLAMIGVDRRLKAEFPDALLLLTVHDELVLEVPEAQLELVTRLVIEEMEGVAQLSVPLTVQTGTGATWYDAKG